MRILISTLMLFVSLQSFAATDAFEKRFKFITNNDGVITEVRDNSLRMDFKVWPFFNHIKDTLLAEQKLMNEKNDYFYEVEQLLFEELYAKGERNSEYMEYIMKSLRKIKDLQVNRVFHNVNFRILTNKFQSRMNEIMSYMNPSTLAKLDNPSFFYRKRVTYQVLLWAMDYAKRKLSYVPALNVMSHLLVESEKMVRQRRLFHQNLLLHYLQNFSAEELGMTPKDVDLIMSSIYESRIPWSGYNESRYARENWFSFGSDKFFKGLRAANRNLMSHQGNYTTLGDRLNYAFKVANIGDDTVILNLFDTANMVDKQPAIAYNFNEPKKVVRSRILLQLSSIGLSMLPINQSIKDTVDTYIKSFYENQMITEGALYGYFEVQGNNQMLKKVKEQYLNPFDNSL